MPRVTSQEVKDFIPDTIGPNSDAARPYIQVATLLVDERLSGKGLSDNMLKTLELFLAAHFATLSLERGGLTVKEVGDAREEYQLLGQNNFGLASTRFGQQAISMDATNTLASLAAGKKALFRLV